MLREHARFLELSRKRCKLKTLDRALFGELEAVGSVASLIAIVELAAKVASSCYKYPAAVKNAEKDITRLRNETEDLKATLQRIQDRPWGKDALHPALLRSLKDCFIQLSSLDEILELPKSKGLREKLKLRQLKWPIKTLEVDKIIENLQSYKQNISLAPQVDQL